MASGTITSGSSLKGRTYQIDWSSEINVTGNYSVITCNHYLINNASFSLDIGNRSNTCTVDGVSVGYTSPAIKTGGGATHHLGTTQHTVWHTADGSKQTTIKGIFNIQATLSQVYVGSVTAEATVMLDTIPRASQPTLSEPSVYLNSWMTIITNRHSTAFKHSLYLQINGKNIGIASEVEDSYPWQPSVDLAAETPNNRIVSATIVCDTISKETGEVIGSKTAPITLVVPHWVAPSISATYRDASSAFSLFNTFVQNVSKLVVEFDVTLAYGSAIGSTSVTLGGSAYSGGEIRGKDSLELIITATDNRGHTGEWKETIDVAEYNPPNVILSAHRCNEDGTANDLGEYAQITVNGGITSLDGKNNLSLVVQHGYEKKEATELPASWIVDAPSSNTMNITATLSDKLYSTHRSMVLSTGYATLDLLAGGKGISFGKSATREGFDCDMYAYLNAGVSTPSVNDVGINRKYISGTSIFKIQTKFSDFNSPDGDSRQSLLLFCNNNHTPVFGMIGVARNGSTWWSGAGDVTFTSDADTGQITVNLPNISWDWATLISGENYSIL